MDVTDSVAARRQRVVGFADVVRIPLRRWRIVVAVTAAVTLTVLAYLLFFPPTYTATTVVVLRPVVTDPFTYPSGGADRAVNMTAENGVALGNEVVDATARGLGRDPDDVRDELNIELPTGGQVLRFEYNDDTEQRAILGANTAAETYLRVREGIYQQQRTTLLGAYDSTVKQVTAQRNAALRSLPGNPGGSRTQALLDQVSALNQQLAELANQRAKIASADLSPGSITAAARGPVPSSRDAAALWLAAALIGGAVLGMCAAHAREALDRRVRSVEQAADLVGVPALGVVRAPGRNADAGAATDARYVSLAVSKWLRRHLDAPLVVLSGHDDEGRTAVAGNLAVALAEAGEDVHLAAPAAAHEELTRILFAAQQRTPPRPRTRVPEQADPARADAAPPGAAPADPAPAAEGVNGSAGLESGHTTVRITTTGGDGARTAPAGAVAVAADPEATVIMRAVEAEPEPEPEPAPAPVPATVAAHPEAPGVLTGDDKLVVVLIGAGVVRLVPLEDRPTRGVVVVDAPGADTDERGVRAAQSGGALLVVASDRTRNIELTRLVERLRAAGAPTVGFVLTGSRIA